MATKTPLIGTYLGLSDLSVVDAIGASGIDFVRIDCAGTLLSWTRVGEIFRAAEALGLTVMLRVREAELPRALLLNPEYVSIPEVRSAEQVRRLVREVELPARGTRDSQTVTFARHELRRPHLSVQIENRAALDDLEAIVEVDGLDGVQTGRGDLSMNLGHPGESRHASVLETELEIFERARTAGLDIGVFEGADAEGLRRAATWLEFGADYLTLGSDFSLLKAAYGGVMGRLRADDGLAER